MSAHGNSAVPGYTMEPRRLINPEYVQWLKGERPGLAPAATVPNPRYGMRRKIAVSNNGALRHRARPHAERKPYATNSEAREFQATRKILRMHKAGVL